MKRFYLFMTLCMLAAHIHAEYTGGAQIPPDGYLRHAVAHAPESVILKDVDGKMSNYVIETMYSQPSTGGSGMDYGILARRCDGDDGCVYLNGVMPMWQDGWIKGEREDGRLVFKTGQLVGDFGEGRKVYMGGALYDFDNEEFVLKDIMLDDFGGIMSLYDDTGSPYYYMLCYDQDSRILELNWLTELIRYDKELVSPPDGIEPEMYVATCRYQGTDDEKNMAGFVRDGSEVWLQGMGPYASKWVKASEGEDGILTVASGQWVSMMGSYVTEFIAGTMDADGEWQPSEAVHLLPDGDGYVMKEGEVALFGPDKWHVQFWQDGYSWSRFNLSAAVPESPDVWVGNCIDEENLTYRFQVWIGPYSEDGDRLEASRMSYRIEVDGKPYVFTPAEYPGLAEDAMSLPLSYRDDKSVAVDGDLVQISLYLKEEPVAVSFISIYDYGTGTAESAPFVWENPQVWFEIEEADPAEGVVEQLSEVKLYFTPDREVEIPDGDAPWAFLDPNKPDQPCLMRSAAGFSWKVADVKIETVWTGHTFVTNAYLVMGGKPYSKIVHNGEYTYLFPQSCLWFNNFNDWRNIAFQLDYTVVNPTNYGGTVEITRGDAEGEFIVECPQATDFVRGANEAIAPVLYDTEGTRLAEGFVTMLDGGARITFDHSTQQACVVMIPDGVFDADGLIVPLAASRFDEISAVSPQKHELGAEPVYDLLGIPVRADGDSLRPGIYIHGGRKVLVKK